MHNTEVFLKVKRRKALYRPVSERIKDCREVALLRDEVSSREQASRCMGCFSSFCHWGCPIGNYVPEWNEYLANGEWEKAYRALQATNNIPEITGRICPALCEASCVLTGSSDEAVTIRENELEIIEHAFRAGFVKPNPPEKRTGRAVAVVGSGPAGLCCADELNKAGHHVVVFERDDEPGGLLRYGIPDFKLEKGIIERRVSIWRKEGIEFRTGVNVGKDYPAARLLSEFNAVCLAGGSRVPRDLQIEGRKLKGIHFALDYLIHANRKTPGYRASVPERIDAKGKRVVVIGGGDTGADCVGTAHRQGARGVVQVEILPQPPEKRAPNDLWPDYPLILRTSTSHEEGGKRKWSVMTKRFIGEAGSVKKLSCVKVECVQKEKTAPLSFDEIPGSEFEIEADLVLLAMGFIYPEKQLLSDLGVRLDKRGNVATNKEHMTSVNGVFSAGDMHRGQSLVVWAIQEGRHAAWCINQYLTGDVLQKSAFTNRGAQ